MLLARNENTPESDIDIAIVIKIAKGNAPYVFDNKH